MTPLASETTAMVDQTSDDTGRRQMRLRCAIYTRKSNEEGLEQDFNSLDAQREACEAFIAAVAGTVCAVTRRTQQ